MVIRVPDCFGELHSKGRVIVPCHCFYDTRTNLLTEIVRNEDKKNEHKFDNLWNLQFNRWWGWNWQRKKKELLRKLKFMHVNKFSSDGCKYENTNDEYFNRGDQVIYPKKYVSKTNLNNKTTSSVGILHKPLIQKQERNVNPIIDPHILIPPVQANDFRKPYVGRRKKNKLKERELEGWIRETTSSSDSEIKKVSRKKTKRYKLSPKDLIRRLRHLNRSNQSLQSDEHEPKTYPVTVYRNQNFNETKSLYTSPITGKVYDLSIPKISIFTQQTKHIQHLNPVQWNDCSFFPKPEFEWFNKYKLMKNEHSELLTRMCDIMCTSDLNNQNCTQNRTANNFASNQKLFEKKCERTTQTNLLAGINQLNETNLKTKTTSNSSLDSYNNQESSLSFADKSATNKINHISNNLPSFFSAISGTDFIRAQSSRLTTDLMNESSEKVLQEIVYT